MLRFVHQASGTGRLGSAAAHRRAPELAFFGQSPTTSVTDGAPSGHWETTQHRRNTAIDLNTIMGDRIKQDLRYTQKTIYFAILQTKFGPIDYGPP